jgi:5-methylcytosine-specific restriction protein A
MAWTNRLLPSGASLYVALLRRVTVVLQDGIDSKDDAYRKQSGKADTDAIEHLIQPLLLFLGVAFFVHAVTILPRPTGRYVVAWSTSDRHSRLPPGWSKIRAAVLKKQPTCQINGPSCTYVSTQADHIVAGDDHSMGNLQGVCYPCHATKSSTEGHTAKPTRRRPPERHPGLRVKA